MGNYFSSAERKFLFYALPFGVGFICSYFVFGLIIGDRVYPFWVLVGVMSLLFFIWSFLRIKHREKIPDRIAKVSTLLDILAYVGHVQFVALVFYSFYHLMYQLVCRAIY